MILSFGLLSCIPKSKPRAVQRVRDARIDVLAMAVAYWTEQMAASVEEEMKKSADARMQEEIDRFNDESNAHLCGGMLMSGKPKQGTSYINLSQIGLRRK